MIRYAILLTIFYVTIPAFIIQDSEVHQPPPFNIQDTEELQLSSGPVIQAKESGSSSKVTKCTVFTCCLSIYLCAPDFSCIDPITHRYMAPAEPCRLANEKIPKRFKNYKNVIN
ncbi:unnamed protein product [Nezara viridula]|uniref:Neuropeptide n=1 Tax=Nezara viridula TaxID=85310 RepID=A0A9P0MGZ0_NEZVI|nr:unnamed protein product [Nezara viridula]